MPTLAAPQGRDNRTFSFLSIPRHEVVELAIGAGFDGVLIDLEHGPISTSAVPQLIAAADARGGKCLVRVGSVQSENVLKTLDAGAAGILFPHINSAEAAALAVASARFAGTRSFNPFVRAAGYGAHIDYVDRADDSCEVICTIESKEGLLRATEISAVDGVDGVFLGPYDLSVALGCPGDIRNPMVVDAIGQVIEAAVDNQRSVSIFAADAVDAAFWRQRGVDTLFIGVDVDLYRRAYLEILSELDDLASRLPEGAL